MKKLLTYCLVVLSATLGAQNLDEGELRKSALDSIEFINYVGPHAYLNTREEISQLGRSLAAGVKTTDRYTQGEKYAVVRVYQPNQALLSADILFLLPDAGVDHIRNLNLIIAGYLESTFSYSSPDARLLADFITRYNAYYRGNMGYASKVYTPGVMAEVTKDNLGLSTLFSEWPGKSAIIIPVMNTLSKGDRGSVHSDEISGPEVTTPLSEEPKGLDQRKELINLKEKEVAKEQEAIVQKEQELNKREAEVLKPKDLPPEQKPDEAKTAVNPAKEGPSTTKPEEPAKNAPVELAQIQKERADLEAKKEQVAQREEKLAQDRQEVAVQENKTLAEDKKAPAPGPGATGPQNPQPPQVEPQVFLSITDAEGKFSQITVLDMKTSKIYIRSPLNTVRGRQYPVLGTSYLVIAGRSEGNGAVHLFTLSQDSLLIKVEGKTEISPSSELLISGNQVYAVAKGPKGEWNLALFNDQLVPLVFSEESVLPGTHMVQKGAFLLLQGKNGQVLKVNPTTLKKEGDFRE